MATVSCGGRLGRTGKTHSQCTHSPVLATARSLSLGLLFPPFHPFSAASIATLAAAGRMPRWSICGRISTTLIFLFSRASSSSLGISLFTHFHAPRPYTLFVRGFVAEILVWRERGEGKDTTHGCGLNVARFASCTSFMFGEDSMQYCCAAMS